MINKIAPATNYPDVKSNQNNSQGNQNKERKRHEHNCNCKTKCKVCKCHGKATSGTVIDIYV